MKRWISVALLLLVSFQASAWWDADWPNRFAITTNATMIDEDIGTYTYPLSEAPAEFWAAVRSDGGDIRVADLTDNQVPIDVAPWDYSGETGDIVFSDSLSTSLNNTLYVYYGNAAATTESAGSTYGSDNVYDSNTKVYLPFSETGGTTAVDRTVNSNDATPNGSMDGSDNVAGPTTDLPGLDLDGTDDWLSIAAAANVDSNTHTISLWMYKDAAAATWFFSMGSDATFANRHMRIQDMDFGGPFRLLMYQNFSTTEGQFRHNTSGEFPAVTTWFKLDITYDAGSTANVPKFYKNGVQVTALGVQTTPSGTRSASTDDIGIGRPSWGETPWNGKIAAFRLANTVRSANYIATVYDMEKNAATFWTTGAEEDAPVGETGWSFPDSVAEAAGGNSEPWTSRSNVLLDAGEASNTLGSAGNATDQLNATWAFSIPTGATIDDIQIRYTARSNTANDMERYVEQLMVGGSRVGSNKVATPGINYTTSAAQYTVGGAPVAYWGLSGITVTEANSIGFSFQATDGGGGSGDTIWVQKIEMNISYTEAGSGPSGPDLARGFFGVFP